MTINQWYDIIYTYKGEIIKQDRTEFKVLLKNFVAFFKFAMPYTMVGATLGMMFSDPAGAAQLFATIATNPTLLPQVASEGEKELKMLDDQGIGMFE